MPPVHPPGYATANVVCNIILYPITSLVLDLGHYIATPTLILTPNTETIVVCIEGLVLQGTANLTVNMVLIH